MKMESAARRGPETNGAHIYKMRTHSFKLLKNKRTQKNDDQEDNSHKERLITGYNCGNKTNIPQRNIS